MGMPLPWPGGYGIDWSKVYPTNIGSPIPERKNTMTKLYIGAAILLPTGDEAAAGEVAKIIVNQLHFIAPNDEAAKIAMSRKIGSPHDAHLDRIRIAVKPVLEFTD